MSSDINNKRFFRRKMSNRRPPVKRLTTRRIRGKQRKVKIFRGKRIRVIGFRNLTDKEAKRIKRKARVKGFVNNPDRSKRSRIPRKNFRRSSTIFGM